MTLCAESLLRSVVTGETRGIVTLSSGGIDLQNVRRDLRAGWRQRMTPVARSPLSVGVVFEIVESRSGSGARAVLQSYCPV